MSPRTGRWIRFLLGLVLSAAGLFLALRNVDWTALGMALRQVDVGWLLAAVVAEMLTIWVNAMRWRLLFWPHHQPRVGWLFGILNVAQLANTVLPGRLGLPLRALLVGEGVEITGTMALSTLAVEKALEGVTLLPVGIVLFLILDLPDWLRGSVLLSASVLLGLLLLIGGGLLWREQLHGWISRWSVGWLARIGRSLLEGLDSLRSARVGWRLWTWSWIYWAVVAAVNGLVIRAVGLDVPPLSALVLFFVLQIGVRLPASPGSLGVFEYLGVASLGLMGADKAPALAATLVLHAVLYLPPSLVGAGYLLGSSIDLGQLRQAVTTVQDR
jgi:uncharacterized protein (TIRG00374 family)